MQSGVLVTGPGPPALPSQESKRLSPSPHLVSPAIRHHRCLLTALRAMLSWEPVRSCSICGALGMGRRGIACFPPARALINVSGENENHGSS